MKPYDSKLQYARVQSEVLLISAGDLDLPVDPSFVHSFAGVVFYNDAAGATPVQPSAGFATFTVQGVVQPHVFQSIPGNVIDVSQPCQVDWALNTEIVRVTPDSIVGVTHWRLYWAGNSA